MLPLFDEAPTFRREALAAKLKELASQNIYIGTSSWKYECLCGQIYTYDRYMTRGRRAPERRRVRVLMFEFGTFAKRTYENVGQFVADLDPFLSKLPGDFQYSLEIRNPDFLMPEYFDCLRHHGVAHVFNAWSRMPELE